jgi:hypothetical protein
MKLNTTKQYLYTGDYYSYTLVTSADGTVTTKQYVTAPQQISADLSINLLGELIIKSPYKMQISGYLKNILDRNGEEIYTNGVWEIVQTAPMLNSLAIKEGYKYRARLISGDV